MIKMMIGLLAAMVFVLAVQAQAAEKTWQKNVTSIVDIPCADELNRSVPQRLWQPVADQNTQGEIMVLLDDPGQES